MAAMREEFSELNLTFSIGGQISFDLFPTVRASSPLMSFCCRRCCERLLFCMSALSPLAVTVAAGVAVAVGVALFLFPCMGR